ncbi:MAG: UTP--glucose-1-phosphate uridylyltransferase [Bdellovibrionales bacterium]|nr:UTP--glucose-1-phosphate uridylyltransferase [Bdellovibrionales bacterium]
MRLRILPVYAAVFLAPLGSLSAAVPTLAEILAGNCAAYFRNVAARPSAEKAALANSLAEVALGDGPDALKAQTGIRQLLGLDDANWNYFWSLYAKEKKGASGPKTFLEIFQDAGNRAGAAIAYPTAIAPPEMMKHLPHVEYSDLAKHGAEYEAAAKESVLWIKKMHAGTGSSMDRTAYLARELGVPESAVHMGAKGTDLYVKVPDPRAPGATVSISLVEAQLLQAIEDARKGSFGGIAFTDILGSETQDSLRAVWNKKCLVDPSKTYAEYFQANPNLVRYGEEFQAYIPTLDEKGAITFDRTAPGGHGLFGVNAIRAAYLPEALPKTDGKHLISVIGNGEDLSSTPDALMVGYMVKHEVPIVMVTTEKTANDLKGGQIALVKEKSDRIYATIIEQAQAKEAGQAELFEQLGVSVQRNGQKAFFNTNMALFNYDVLHAKITRAIRDFGEAEFIRKVSPDLIQNWKEQKDAAGAARKFLQMEGASGSSYLNLDRFWREHYHENLVHFVNVDKTNRTRFFSPIKSAFDYFMQFHSDRFSFDAANMRLVNNVPGRLPAVSLKGASYASVESVLNAFAGAKIRELDALTIEGDVVLKGATLKGKVAIKNTTGRTVDLRAYFAAHPDLPRDAAGNPILSDLTLDIRE